jgi:hypothetical protein
MILILSLLKHHPGWLKSPFFFFDLGNVNVVYFTVELERSPLVALSDRQRDPWNHLY